MIKVLIFFRQMVGLLTSRHIHVSDKLIFPIIYPFFLAVNYFNTDPKCVKRTIFIGTRPLTYFGNHRNLALDHISEHINSYAKYYHDAKTVIDVGSSFGTFSLMVNYVNPNCSIFAVEPGQKSFSILTGNVNGRQNIYPINMAVGKDSGEVKFFEDLDYPEGSRLICDNDSVIAVSDKATGISVCQTSLDDLILSKQISSIDLIKIDTEGFELDVLLGASEALKITKFLIVEISMTKMKHLIEILSLLELHSYRIIDIGSQNRNGIYVDSMDIVFWNSRISSDGWATTPIFGTQQTQ